MRRVLNVCIYIYNHVLNWLSNVIAQIYSGSVYACMGFINLLLLCSVAPAATCHESVKRVL
jgi:hypothetical protein